MGDTLLFPLNYFHVCLSNNSLLVVHCACSPDMTDIDKEAVVELEEEVVVLALERRKQHRQSC